MLIGSKIPLQADIIKFVIAGRDPRVAGHDSFRESCPERKTEQPEIDIINESVDLQPVSR